MDNALDVNIVETFVAVNTDDQKNKILKYNENLNIKVCGNLLGLCKPIYALSSILKCEESDIILVICDDTAPIFHWDKYLTSLFCNDNIWSIFLNDGLQNPNNNINPVITMPVMTFSCLKKLNYKIYDPEYNHYFCDNELWFNLMELGLLTDLRTSSKIFQHEHYELGKRQIDSIDENIIKNCSIKDRETYSRRMQMNVEERLKT
jgi:hypothetical protein